MQQESHECLMKKEWDEVWSRVRQTENATIELKTLVKLIMDTQAEMKADLKALLQRRAEDNKQGFWNSKAAEKLPLYFTVLICVIVAALVGTNLIEFVQKLK